MHGFRAPLREVGAQVDGDALGGAEVALARASSDLAVDLSAESRTVAAGCGDDAARVLREAMEAAESAGAERSRDFYRAALLLVIRGNSELIVPLEPSA